MLQSTITTYGDSVTVQCPHCNHAEDHPADEQRHHLQTFSIEEWKEDDSKGKEVSLMSCHVCKNEFTLTWDYGE